MTSCARWLLARVLLTTLSVGALALPAGAQQTITGSGLLFARDKVRARRCGRAQLDGPQTLLMGAGGAWATTDEGGEMLTGTYVPLGTQGRKFDLAFDAPSLAMFQSDLERYLSELCHTLVQVTSIETKRFRVMLNRRATRATVEARFRLVGTANGTTKRGSFRVTARGPWTAVSFP
jgi:hypothetical protein